MCNKLKDTLIIIAMNHYAMNPYKNKNYYSAIKMICTTVMDLPFKTGKVNI